MPNNMDGNRRKKEYGHTDDDRELIVSIRTYEYYDYTKLHDSVIFSQRRDCVSDKYSLYAIPPKAGFVFKNFLHIYISFFRQR